jgi:hypothetical protein
LMNTRNVPDTPGEKMYPVKRQVWVMLRVEHNFAREKDYVTALKI